MSEYQIAPLTAALLYKRHDPFNFKHLATTLNLILEPTEIRFRVIHERPGATAVLSCPNLHILLNATASDSGSPFLNTSENAHALPNPLKRRVETHKRILTISIGIGPLPQTSVGDDTSAADLLPLIGQMVVNHLLNMNPAEAVYWGGTGRLMTPKEFLDMINGPLPVAPEDQPPPRRAATSPA